MPKDDVVRLPPVDRFIGSCPICGKKIWSSYLFNYKTINTGTGSTNIEVYKCIECKEHIPLDSIIPF